MRNTERQRQKQAPCRKPDVGLDPKSPGSGRKPDVGLDPKSPGSGSGLKTALNHGATQAALYKLF